MPTGKGKLTGEHRGTVDDADKPDVTFRKSVKN
jgi:hypothetical protein